MNVTSETLFHFTDSLKNIKSILAKKFMLSYCHESFSIDDEVIFNHYFPMISFCDLPLTLAKDHIYKYGSYAIGLSKDWGIRNKLNPVIYIEKNSIVASDLKIALKAFKKMSDDYYEIKKLQTENQKKMLDVLFDSMKKAAFSNLSFMRNIKNYQAELKRKDIIVDKNYRFYDEREWRFMPSFEDDRVDPMLDENKYKKLRGSLRMKLLIDKIILNFTVDDIKYLIVKSNVDIPKLVRFIKSTDNLIKNADEADILTTRILTTDQLRSDF